MGAPKYESDTDVVATPETSTEPTPAAATEDASAPTT